MYDVLVFDHRLAEHRPLDSKSELARLLFGYTTGNGQNFPAQPDLVRFVARPGGEVVNFVYRAEGRRTEGSLARIGNGELRVR
jgi:hypothetical protein